MDSDADVDKLVVRIADILRTLPIVENRRVQIDAHAVRLALAADLTQINDHPRARNVGTKAAIKQIEALAADLLRVWHDIEGLSGNVLDGVTQHMEQHPFHLQADIMTLIKACDQFVGELRTGTPTETKLGANKKGRAEAVAAVAHNVYVNLTGNQHPTWTNKTDPGHKAVGPYISYLTAIFEVLGVDASAANQAKKVRVKMASQKRN